MALHTAQSHVHIAASGDGSAIEALGAVLACRAAGTIAGRSFTLVEYTFPPFCMGLAPHWHVRTTEVFYVVDGTLACTVGEKTITATHGTCIPAPPHLIHAFWNPTAAPVTLLAWSTPGDFERCCVEFAALLVDEAAQPPTDQRRIAALGDRYDIWLPDA